MNRARRRLPLLAPLLLACWLAGCSSGPPSRPAGSLKQYSAYGITVEADFPGTPAVVPNPFAFRYLFTGHKSATAWSIGNLGSYKVGSYELVFIRFPPGEAASAITDELEGYGGTSTKTLYGRPGIENVSPTKNARYAGVEGFSTGDVLVIAGGYDVVDSPVKRFIDSLRLVRP